MLAKYLLDIVIYTTLAVNGLLYVFGTKMAGGKTLYWFRWYAWLMIVNQAAASYLAHKNMLNLYLSHVYFLSQFITLSLLYRHLFKSVLLKKMVQYVLYVILLILLVQFSIWPKLIMSFNVLEVFLCSVSLVVYAVIYLYRSLEYNNKKWIYFSAGLMLYLLSSTLVFTGGDMLIKNTLGKATFINFWNINNYIYLFYQLLVLVEWFKSFRKSNLQTEKPF